MLSNVQLFTTPQSAACQVLNLPLPPRVCSNSCPLNSCCYLTFSSSSPFASSLSQHQGLFQGLDSSHGVAKVLELSPSNEYSRLTGLISLQSYGLSRVFSNILMSLKSSILWCSTLFMVQISHLYMTTGKTIGLSR